MTFNSSTFSTTYKDDYKDSSEFYRILFNGGKYLQPRELNQLQTILQKQITRIGNNLYKDGAAINPGNLVADNRYEFVKLDTGAILPSTLSSLVGQEFTGSASGVKAKIVEVIGATGSDPDTFYVRYTDTSLGTSGATPIRFDPGETITDGSYPVMVQTINSTANPAVGKGTKVSSDSGEFFVNGFSVFAPKQSVIVSKYTEDPTADIGFKVTENIVTANSDISLYDNANATPNLSAPGADRYKISLTLTTRASLTNGENFVYIGHVALGKLEAVVKATDTYNVISDLLALRTKEESGNYLVKPFRLNFDLNDSDATKLKMDVSRGVAYINGYRAENKYPLVLNIDKARTTAISNNEVVSANYGSYVIANSGKGLPNVGTNELYNLRSLGTYGGTTIGTARIRGVERSGSSWKIYLFDIAMNVGQSFRNTVSIGLSTTNYFNLTLENNKAVIKSTIGNNLLFPLPSNMPSTLTDISLTVQRRFSTTTNASGVASLTLTGTGETFANTTDWIMSDAGSNIDSAATITGSGTASASISGAQANSSNFEILGYVNKSIGSARTKTLMNRTVSAAVGSDGTGLQYVDLVYPDIYDVSVIKQTDSNGVDLASNFVLDDGQRDNFYDKGRIILNKGQTAPSGNVFVKYQSFDHGTSGDFFSVNSYSGQVNYENIPDYTFPNGDKINLRNVLDFRPVVNTLGTYSGSGSAVNELPKNTDLITLDATYYLPRRDRLVINTDGNVSVISGVPSTDPKYPDTPGGALDLYNIDMHPFTLNDSDVSTTFIETKGYTMSDIGTLENRITKLEELTSLSLLELETKNWAVLDSTGINRAKSGFFVDNFSDHFFSDTNSQEFKASIDIQNQILRPTFYADNIGLMYDSALSSNTIRKGDNIYLKYTEQSLIDQNVATTTMNINPFSVITNNGTINLSPASDTWKDFDFSATRSISGGTQFNTSAAFMWNEWAAGWHGSVARDLHKVGDRSRNATIGGRRGFNRIASSQMIREVIGDRIVDVTIIPFMRSRKIYFKAEGLKPSTRLFPFFDNKRVDSWVKAEPFVQFSTADSDYGNLYNSATGHPDTASSLITDATGSVEGSFFIPNTPAIKFRTGEKEFKLLDVSTNINSMATSTASAMFSASGVIETHERTIRTTRSLIVVGSSRIIPTRNIEHGGGEPGNFGYTPDPLAQTFRPFTLSDGIYVTKVDAYFASKDQVLPIQMQIRPVINGYPSSHSALPGAIKYMPPSLVNTSANGTIATTFEFDEPVYLESGKDYAIVLLADTTEYNVYVSQVGEFLIGSTQDRVTRQPSLGSLFKSQNASTWTPMQDYDLKFKVYRAEFGVSSGFATFENKAVPMSLLSTDPITTLSGSASVTVKHPHHGLIIADTVKILGVDSASSIGGISGASFLGNRIITAVDETGYTYNADSSATSSITGGGSAVNASRNIQYNVSFPSIQTLLPRSTLVTSEIMTTTGRSLAGVETAYQKDAAYTNIELNNNNEYSAPRMVANRENETSQISGSKSMSLKLNMSTTNGIVAPMIDAQRTSVVLISNSIDNQASSASAGYNVPLNYTAETNNNSGSHASKHVTNQIDLDQDAVGLKVLLSANRPAVTDFDVYYRVGTGEDVLKDAAWTLVSKESAITSDEIPTIFRQYEYLVGGKGGTLNAFSKFQIKIVMRSTNSSKVPVFSDIRVIALGV